MNPLKITVCELDNDYSSLEEQWPHLVKHVRENKSDFLLLPEMIFSPWFAHKVPFHEDDWKAAVQQHDSWILRLNEFDPTVTLGSRPAETGKIRINQGFVREPENGYQAVHTKYYLPDEEGFWEASWYQRESCSFQPCQTGKIKIGFAICTDMWFYQHARAYGKQDVDLIAVPRATPHGSINKWLAGGRAARRPHAARYRPQAGPRADRRTFDLGVGNTAGSRSR